MIGLPRVVLPAVGCGSLESIFDAPARLDE